MSEGFLTHQQRVADHLATIRATFSDAGASSDPEVHVFVDVVADLRAETKRGPRSPGTASTWLARAQAKRCLKAVADHPESFARLGGLVVDPQTPHDALILLEAFKLWLDDPEAEEIYGRYGDERGMRMRRAARTFGKYILCSCDYDGAARTAGMPPTHFVFTDPEHGRVRLHREGALDRADEAYAQECKRNGWSTSQISDDLGVRQSDVSRLVSTQATHRRAYASRTTAPPSPAGLTVPDLSHLISRPHSGVWQFRVRPNKIVAITDDDLLSLIDRYW